MITVKLYGLLRLESGMKELLLPAASIQEVHAALLLQAARITQKDLDGCVILINGKKGNKRSRLKDGDEVVLLPPVAGG